MQIVLKIYIWMKLFFLMQTIYKKQNKTSKIDRMSSDWDKEILIKSDSIFLWNKTEIQNYISLWLPHILINLHFLQSIFSMIFHWSWLSWAHRLWCRSSQSKQRMTFYKRHIKPNVTTDAHSSLSGAIEIRFFY